MAEDGGRGGAAQFKIEGGDNSIQESGTEAPASELEAAAAALHGYLDARAAGAWSAACSYMATGTGAQLAGEGGASCPRILTSLSEGIAPASLRRAAIADVGALRIEGEGGFILFHGVEGVEYFMPMVREEGSWKVAALVPSALL